MTKQAVRKIKCGDSVILPDNTIHEISSIQAAHDRYQLMGVSGWQYGIDSLVWVQPGTSYLYWKTQAKNEKERADTLLGANQMYQVELVESLGREAKLREAIEEEVKKGIIWGDYNRAKVLRELLASLYPEEGEAK